MNHYCNKISQNLRSIFAVSKKLPESITLAKIHPVGQIKSQLEKLQEKHYEILHERNFGEREKLARKIGAECVDNFHEGVAWATWREKDGTKVLRLIKQSGEWVASPSLSPFGYRNIHDYTPVKNGVTWLFRHTRSGENEITAYVIDIKHGSSYKPEYKEVDLSHFTSDNLVYLRHYSSADNRNYSFFIKGYGEILKEKGFEGELFDEACPFDKTGHAWVRNGKNIRLINTKGEATGETNQPYLQQVLPMNEGLFWVKLAVSPAMQSSTYFVLYDYLGREQARLAEQDWAPTRFSEGLCVVENSKEKACYYVDQHGERASGNFAFAGDFHDGLAAVKDEKNGEFYFIDKSGKRAFPGNSRVAFGFKRGLAAVLSLDMQWSFIDTSGRSICAQTFDDLEFFRDDTAAVELEDGWYRIDRQGRFVFEK